MKSTLRGSMDPMVLNIIDWLDGEGFWAMKRFEAGDTVDNMATETNPVPHRADRATRKSKAIFVFVNLFCSPDD